MKKKNVISEKRRNVRIFLNTPIQVKYHFIRDYDDQSESPGDALSSNISGGGLFLELPHLETKTQEELLKGEKKLFLEILLPNTTEPIKALGKVAWMEEKEERGKALHGAGVTFISIDEDDREKIINYIIGLYRQSKKF